MLQQQHGRARSDSQFEHGRHDPVGEGLWSGSWTLPPASSSGFSENLHDVGGLPMAPLHSSRFCPQAGSCSRNWGLSCPGRRKRGRANSAKQDSRPWALNAALCGMASKAIPARLTHLLHKHGIRWHDLALRVFSRRSDRQPAARPHCVGRAPLPASRRPLLALEVRLTCACGSTPPMTTGWPCFQASLIGYNRSSSYSSSLPASC